MRQLFIAIFITVAAVCTNVLNAQNITTQLQQAADTVKIERPPLADSTLIGTTIFQLLQQEGNGSVELNQPQEMEQAYQL